MTKIIFRFVCKESNDINFKKERSIEALGSLITYEEITDINEPRLSSLQDEDIWDLRNKFPQFDIKWENKKILIHGPKYDKINLTSHLREKIIDRLIKDQPNVPFYWEIKCCVQYNKNDKFMVELDCTSQEFKLISADLNANLNNRVKNLLNKP
ncbi:hypothetical protein BpHYR1_052545 [Brachionus plicatilis]|uniref:Uncharacterized protein n=1 Tax=Brachionus plicatilis TaxID=10195 RepID=A0A3M7RXP6_BRAPC|nr:hypothetical protein BpHYR1_052545 [Brachionus plicatilis]